ncbi:MAG: site-2 protease family protein [Candidatus Limnocylindrales bacterium]
MDDRTLASIIVVAIMLLVGFPVHEFAHALAAYRLGDSTARFMGRLTLNPIAHFDPLGGILLAVTFIGSGFGFGWAKPTPVNPANLEGGHRGEAIVAAAGPISNLILAIMVALPLRYLIANPELLDAVPRIVLLTMQLFIFINLVLMVFNLLPIPPLDGSKVLFAFLSPRQTWQWRPILEQYGFILLLVLFFVPPGNSIGGQILGPILDGLFSLLVGV